MVATRWTPAVHWFGEQAPDSDLVMVETRFAAPPPESDETNAPRARRVRPARPAVVEEPLQMVETHKGQASPP